MADLKEFRNRIDAIDDQIRMLFLERMETVAKIADFKMSLDQTVYDHDRENEVFERNLAGIEDEQSKAYYREVLETILKVSKDYQKYLIIRSTL